MTSFKFFVGSFHESLCISRGRECQFIIINLFCSHVFIKSTPLLLSSYSSYFLTTTFMRILLVLAFISIDVPLCLDLFMVNNSLRSYCSCCTSKGFEIHLYHSSINVFPWEYVLSYIFITRKYIFLTFIIDTLYLAIPSLLTPLWQWSQIPNFLSFSFSFSFLLKLQCVPLDF